MKIYTRTGDSGETGLLGGVLIPKSNLVICACGELDETNCQIGLARSYGVSKAVDDVLGAIQKDLFVLGSQVADCLSEKASRAASLQENRIAQLEQHIDEFESELEPMDAFILPGGCTAGAQLHVARTVCRRAERTMVKMLRKTNANATRANAEIPNCVIFLNRLSDLLFVMARHVNHANDSQETKWLPG